MSLGVKLRNLRHSKNFSQAEIAERLKYPSLPIIFGKTIRQNPRPIILLKFLRFTI
nr:helix-turn-helix domain-containing protein [Chryseobacterium taihuense]